MLDYIRTHVQQAKTAPLAGNSIATDRGFIARDMPTLDDYLHYRMIDVSSHQGTVPALVSADLLRPAGEGPRPSRAGRHPRVDPRAAVLPPHRVRRRRRARRPATSRRSPPNSGRRTATPRQSIRPQSARAANIDDAACASRLGGDGGCSSVGRAPGCDPGCRGFESRQPPRRSEDVCAFRRLAFWRCVSTVQDLARSRRIHRGSAAADARYLVAPIRIAPASSGGCSPGPLGWPLRGCATLPAAQRQSIVLHKADWPRPSVTLTRWPTCE